MFKRIDFVLYGSVSVSDNTVRVADNVDFYRYFICFTGTLQSLKGLGFHTDNYLKPKLRWPCHFQNTNLRETDHPR